MSSYVPVKIEDCYGEAHEVHFERGMSSISVAI